MLQPLDDALGFIMNRTSTRFKNELGRRFKPYDVTPEQWVVLHRLGEEDGLSQKELAARIFKDQPNTTRILDKLEQKKLIVRSDSRDDRRAFRVHLTDGGKSLLSTLMEIALRVRSDACRGLDDKEMARLKSMLNRIWRNLE